MTKTYGTSSKLDITTDYKISEGGLAADSSVKSILYTGLKSYLPATATKEEFMNTNKFVEGSKKVDATIYDDLKKGAFKAMFWSLLIITVYIFIRFRDWRFSVGTIISLLHDVLVTLAVFSFLKNVVPFPLEIECAERSGCVVRAGRVLIVRARSRCQTAESALTDLLAWL